MGSSFASTLVFTALLLLAAVHLVRTWRGQALRVERLEEEVLPRRPVPSHRPVPLAAVLPPAEDHQPCLDGVPLPGGLMAWPPPLSAAEALTELCLARRGPTAYLGPAPDAAVLHLGGRALDAGVDPRGRLLVPRDARDLEQTLATRPLTPPWIVVEGDPDLEGLDRLHRRFGCPVLLTGQEVPPPGYRGPGRDHR